MLDRGLSVRSVQRPPEVQGVAGQDTVSDGELAVAAPDDDVAPESLSEEADRLTEVRPGAIRG